MSDVELFWNAVTKNFQVNTTWGELHRDQQYQVVHAINMLINVLNFCSMEENNVQQ